MIRADRVPSTPPTTTSPAVALLPHDMTHADEFLLLMDLSRRTNCRLNELLSIVGPDYGLQSVLPLSGLRLVSTDDGSLLCKGGPRS